MGSRKFQRKKEKNKERGRGEKKERTFARRATLYGCDPGF